MNSVEEEVIDKLIEESVSPYSVVLYVLEQYLLECGFKPQHGSEQYHLFMAWESMLMAKGNYYPSNNGLAATGVLND